MLWRNPPNVRPTSTPLRRYMSFAAFVRLLQTKSLHFSRLDQLDDPLEGVPPLSIRRARDKHRTEALRELEKMRPKLERALRIELPDDITRWVDLYTTRTESFRQRLKALYPNEAAAIEQIATSREIKFVEDFSDFYRDAEKQVLSRRQLSLWRMCLKAELYIGLLSRVDDAEEHIYFVNCWHQGRGESFAMWNLYCKDGLGVGVCTDSRRFLNLLERHSGDGDWRGGDRLRFRLAHVIYADRMTKKVSPFSREPIVKRKAFSHEREVRAFAGLPIGASPDTIGLEVRIRLQELLTGILIHPAAPDWFRATVREVTSKYGLTSVPVETSNLQAPRSSTKSGLVHRVRHRSRKILRANLIRIPWRDETMEKVTRY